MKGVVRIPLEEARPAPEAVLADQGLPEGDLLAPRLRSLLVDALRAFEELAHPRAVVAEMAPPLFAEVLDGLEAPAGETVVGQVLPRARHAALFVATLGEPVSRRIAELFAEDDFARAWMLDAVCSSAADRLADLPAARLEDALARRGAGAERALPYSPGYCGWSVKGQRRLFAAIDAGAIGVALNDSCLMSPIKSVSGVLLAGPAEMHRIRPEFAFCAECQSRACARRMASVLRA